MTPVLTKYLAKRGYKKEQDMEEAFSPMNPDLATNKDKTTILHTSGERIVTRIGQELSQAAIDESVCETIMAE